MAVTREGRRAFVSEATGTVDSEPTRCRTPGIRSGMAAIRIESEYMDPHLRLSEAGGLVMYECHVRLEPANAQVVVTWRHHRVSEADVATAKGSHQTLTPLVM